MKAHINDLPDNLTSDPKLFTGNTFISKVTDPNAAANQINNDLIEISRWASLWKISFLTLVNKHMSSFGAVK